MINGILLTIRRECLLAWRRPIEWLNPLLFFFLVSVLFPLTLAPDIKLLQIIGPGILWIGLLLAILWSLSRLFQADFEDGSLEQWLFSPYPLPVLVFAKMIAHVLMLAIPVLLISPLLALMFHLTHNQVLVLFVTLILGTPLLTFIGAIGAALTVSVRQTGLLLALILLPLYIPTLIFATSALSAAAAGLSPVAPIIWLAALLAFTLVLAPWITAITLRMNIVHL